LNALLDLDSNKDPDPACGSAFALPLCLLFTRSLLPCVFPDMWKLPFVTPIFKSGKRKDVWNYRGIAILSTVGKLFELLINRYMYEDMKDQLANCQHGFYRGRSTISNLLEYSSLVLKSIEDGCQVDSIYMDFSKTFNKGASSFALG
jgi:hypothetical protein